MKTDALRLHRLCLLALILFFMFTGPGIAYGAGLKVSPGAFSLQNARVGEDVDLDIDLVITNKGDEERVFVISTTKPQKIKIKGYTEIPDPSWFYFDKNRVKIGPGQEAKVAMHLKVPDKAKYYNQHWLLYAQIRGEAKKGETFEAAVAPNYMIETQAKADIETRPHGELGLAPSTVKATVVVPGTEEKVNFKIYNNDDKKHVYAVYSYIPKATKAKQDISGTPGYEWIGDEDWLKPATRALTLNPGQAKEVSLDIFIPKGEKCKDKGWESIIYVEPEKGQTGFVRILIEPLK